MAFRYYDRISADGGSVHCLKGVGVHSGLIIEFHTRADKTLAGGEKLAAIKFKAEGAKRANRLGLNAGSEIALPETRGFQPPGEWRAKTEYLIGAVADALAPKFEVDGFPLPTSVQTARKSLIQQLTGRKPVQAALKVLNRKIEVAPVASKKKRDWGTFTAAVKRENEETALNFTGQTGNAMGCEVRVYAKNGKVQRIVYASGGVYADGRENETEVSKGHLFGVSGSSHVLRVEQLKGTSRAAATPHEIIDMARQALKKTRPKLEAKQETDLAKELDGFMLVARVFDARKWRR